MISSPLLGKIRTLTHGFGDRAEPIPSVLKSAWDGPHPQWKQVHGSQCVEVTTLQQECGEADGLYSRLPGVVLGVVTADCVPILMAHRSGNRIASAHAGWRGTQSQIVSVLCEKLKDSGEDLSEWVAALGPAIGPCCFEVEEKLVSTFRTTFSDLPPSLVSPEFRKLDLITINEHLLTKAGVGNIDTMRICTYCLRNEDGTPVFSSYRRDGSGTRQLSLISNSPRAR